MSVAPAEQPSPALGTFCSLPSPAVVEMVGWAGFDFVILDAEHTLVSAGELAHLLRAAAAAGLPALVRVARPTSELIGPVLDAGATGIVVARVRTADAARAAVDAVRHHPLGRRGLDAGRATRYGAVDLRSFARNADDAVRLVVMVEDHEGLEAVGDIVAVPGVDAVLAGAADLSQSLGIPWETTASPVVAAVERVEEACRAAGTAFWAVPRRPDDVPRWRARGVRTFVSGDARNVAARALAEHAARERESLDG